MGITQPEFRSHKTFILPRHTITKQIVHMIREYVRERAFEYNVVEKRTKTKCKSVVARYAVSEDGRQQKKNTRDIRA